MTIAPATTSIHYSDFEDSTSLLGDAEALRSKGKADGYLFFKGLLPYEDVIKVRDAVYSVLMKEGSLSDDKGAVSRDYIDAIDRDDMRLDIGVSNEGYATVQKVMGVHALPHHPALLALYRELFGTPVFVHPRHIVRAMTGHPALRPTPAHQDFPLIQGSQNTWTAWFPLDDCPVKRGPLSVLRGSNHDGYFPIAAAEGAGGLEALLCRDDVDWVSQGFSIGDVLTFPSLTVHRAVPATQKDRLRLSMDIRFQPFDEPIEAKSLTNHSDRPWDEIYEGWESDDFQYYWNSSYPKLSPWDDSYLQPGVRIC